MEVTRLNTQCIDCLLRKYLNKIPDNASENEKLNYKRRLLRLIAEAPHTCSAPEITTEIAKLQKELFNYKEDFSDIKKHFNSLMLGLEAEIESKINRSPEPIKTAIAFAMLGNYIDFGAMQNVDEGKLHTLIKSYADMPINPKEYTQLISDLEKAEKLVYITDNCGEVVMDKLLIKTILNEYPNLKAEAIVRGSEVLNDATLNDAAQVGLLEILPVSGNGTEVAGTCLKELPLEIKEKLNNADIIISKGQANFETLRYCNKNIYYIFMCKCELFANRFNVPKYSGMLINDLRM